MVQFTQSSLAEGKIHHRSRSPKNEKYNDVAEGISRLILGRR